MLSEQIVVSTLRPLAESTLEATLSVYDVHTYKHVTSFKRSNTARNGLAVSDTHIYAAQAEKAVVNVYSREKGSLVSTVPFTEQFTVLEASHNGAFVAGGTENGRLTIWEVASGRFISTGHIHLQRVTAITFDPSDNFILTGSADSNVYTWAVPILTDFRSERKPERILDHHQREITSIVCGKGDGPANICITASRDLSCIVWNYQTGTFLRRFLFTIPPLVLALDPADRAFYVGFEDGTLQCIDFHGDSLPQPSNNSVSHKLFAEEGRNVPITIGDGARGRKWVSSGHDSAVTSIAVIYEGNFVVSGNEKGDVCVWDVATGSLFRRIVQMKGTITALKLLRPTGFLTSRSPQTTTQSTPLKPRYDSLLSSSSPTSMSSPVPSYTLTTQFISSIPQTITSSLFPSTQSSFSAISSDNDMQLITDGARQIIHAGGSGGSTQRRVEELEDELVRMHRSYEALVGLHKGLWEKQVKWMLEVEEGKSKGRIGDSSGIGTGTLSDNMEE